MEKEDRKVVKIKTLNIQHSTFIQYAISKLLKSKTICKFL